MNCHQQNLPSFVFFFSLVLSLGDLIESLLPEPPLAVDFIGEHPTTATS